MHTPHHIVLADGYSGGLLIDGDRLLHINLVFLEQQTDGVQQACPIRTAAICPAVIADEVSVELQLVPVCDCGAGVLGYVHVQPGCDYGLGPIEGNKLFDWLRVYRG